MAVRRVHPMPRAFDPPKPATVLIHVLSSRFQVSPVQEASSTPPTTSRRPSSLSEFTTESAQHNNAAVSAMDTSLPNPLSEPVVQPEPDSDEPGKAHRTTKPDTEHQRVVIRPAPYEHSSGRRTGVHGEFQNNPRFKFGAITTETHPRAVSEFARIRDELRVIVTSHTTTTQTSAMLLLCLVVPEPDKYDDVAYPSVPTVVIFVEDPAAIVAQILALPFSLRVEISKGSFERMGSSGQNKKQECGTKGDLWAPANTGFHQLVPMGQSLGVQGSPHSGTMGGYVQGERTHRIWALTNGRVGLMDESMVIPPVELTPSVDDGRKRMMVQPSYQDSLDELAGQEERMKSAIKNSIRCAEMDPKLRKKAHAAVIAYNSLYMRDNTFGKVDYLHFGLLEGDAKQEDCKVNPLPLSRPPTVPGNTTAPKNPPALSTNGNDTADEDSLEREAGGDVHIPERGTPGLEIEDIEALEHAEKMKKGRWLDIPRSAFERVSDSSASRPHIYANNGIHQIVLAPTLSTSGEGR